MIVISCEAGLCLALTRLIDAGLLPPCGDRDLESWCEIGTEKIRTEKVREAARRPGSDGTGGALLAIQCPTSQSARRHPPLALALGLFSMNRLPCPAVSSMSGCASWTRAPGGGSLLLRLLLTLGLGPSVGGGNGSRVSTGNGLVSPTQMTGRGYSDRKGQGINIQRERDERQRDRES